MTFLQHLPAFKGIETKQVKVSMKVKSCSTSLPSKGLRPLESLYGLSKWLAAPPCLQRDWDNSSDVTNATTTLQHLPAFKGIETGYWWHCCSVSSCSTSLPSKGLRRRAKNTIKNIYLAAPPWLQRDWDCPASCARFAFMCLETSLTLKGYT